MGVRQARRRFAKAPSRWPNHGQGQKVNLHLKRSPHRRDIRIIKIVSIKKTERYKRLIDALLRSKVGYKLAIISNR